MSNLHENVAADTKRQPFAMLHKVRSRFIIKCIAVQRSKYDGADETNIDGPSMTRGYECIGDLVKTHCFNYSCLRTFCSSARFCARVLSYRFEKTLKGYKK